MAYMMDAGISAVIPPLPDGCALSFDPAFIYYPPTGAPSGRRHYLIPGLYMGLDQWDTDPFNTFAPVWRNAGDELISIAHPIAVACFFTNGGWQYRDGFNNVLNTVMNAIEAAHGPARVNIAGGMSFGGLHSMQAAACNGRIKNWWAHLPVTRIDALSEFPSVGNVERFNPQYEIAALAPKPGWLGWGTADTRTNWTLVAALAPQLPLVTSHEYPRAGPQRIAATCGRHKRMDEPALDYVGKVNILYE